MNLEQASKTELLTIIGHDPTSRLSDIVIARDIYESKYGKLPRFPIVQQTIKKVYPR
ncbi:hypothetical protein [Paenibacillus sp. MMO-58]|uniref:hypothetical protein n=1 Tax=Paenibacillus sp. MMO-58 TaxID=3081290 RepID=UPI00301AFD08